jgi:MFS family permease
LFKISKTQSLIISPWRVVLPVALGTGLSLLGDTSLYAVLPTHTADAGVIMTQVGLLLSANRFIRLALNGPAGLIYDRYPRRYLFVSALFIGALSTAMYALTTGFWPLLVGRLLWGLAWSGIWVGGNTIILDISQAQNRGRWIGIYQTAFYFGASSGAVLGGLLTDWLGYHRAMGIGAGLTLFGAIIAFLFLPETRQTRLTKTSEPMSISQAAGLASSLPTRQGELISAISLMGVNRLLLAGVLLPTFGLFLSEHVGNSIEVATVTIGVATLTGIALGANGLISMTTAPVMGGLSDRLGNRWQAAAGGLVPGITGFGLLAMGSPLMALVAIPLTAIAGGSNQSLSTALVGDLSDERLRGRRMGILFTIGDLTSALGPPLAYSMIPLIGINSIYLFGAGVFALMFVVALRWTVTKKVLSEA